MQLQLAAILVPSADADLAAFEQALLTQTLPAIDASASTRSTRGFRQSVRKGQDELGRRTYYLWQAELDTLMDTVLVGQELETAASRLIDELFTTMRDQLAAQNATVTSPLTALPEE